MESADTLQILRQTCEECIRSSDPETLARVMGNAKDDIQSVLLLGNVSGAMLYKVLIPALKLVFPDKDFIKELEQKITDSDVLMAIFRQDIDADDPGLRPLIEGITRNRLRAMYILELLNS